MLKAPTRFEYQPISRRPAFTWPGGRKLAVYVALNLEAYSFGEGIVEEIATANPGPAPDVMNWSWLEYGNRVGAWRLRDLFAELGMPVTLLVNSALYRHAPELPAAFQSIGAEISAHGRSNSERQGNLPEHQERALIAEATATIAQASGQQPAGWLGPWISESVRTPDLLAEAGYDYLLDWCCDDQPIWFRTRTRPILAVPYPQELNDSNTVIGRRVNPDAFAQMIIDNFAEMRRQVAGSDAPALVMGISFHAHCAGQPFRLHHFRKALEHIARYRDEVWLTTARQIAHAYAAAVPPRGSTGSSGTTSVLPG